MRTLNVVLKIYKHIIIPLDVGVNRHIYQYKIERIEVYDNHYLIKSIGTHFPFNHLNALILCADKPFNSSTQYVFKHSLDNENNTHHIDITPHIEKGVVFNYDLYFIENIIKRCDIQWLT